MVKSPLGARFIKYDTARPERGQAHDWQVSQMPLSYRATQQPQFAKIAGGAISDAVRGISKNFEIRGSLATILSAPFQTHPANTLPLLGIRFMLPLLSTPIS